MKFKEIRGGMNAEVAVVSVRHTLELATGFVTEFTFNSTGTTA